MKQTNAAILEIENHHEFSFNYKDSKTAILIDKNTIHPLPFSYEKSSDEALTSLYVNNKDEKAFNKIAERYNDIILGFAMKLIRNVQDVEEVRQDVFLILTTKLHTFNGNSKFSTWLYKITINKCFKYLNYKKKKVNTEINLDEIYSNIPTNCSKWNKQPDEIALLMERINIISNAANEFTQSNREMLILKT
jgi:RNA polymerase sigma factor (sigma-70 family)